MTSKLKSMWKTIEMSYLFSEFSQILLTGINKWSYHSYVPFSKMSFYIENEFVIFVYVCSEKFSRGSETE